MSEMDLEESRGLARAIADFVENHKGMIDTGRVGVLAKAHLKALEQIKNNKSWIKKAESRIIESENLLRKTLEALDSFGNPDLEDIRKDIEEIILRWRKEG